MTDPEILTCITSIASGEASEDEISLWLEQLERELRLPEGYMSDLIFWPSRYGLGSNPTAADILQAARRYRPIVL